MNSFVQQNFQPQEETFQSTDVKLSAGNCRKCTSAKLPWIPIEFTHNFFLLSAFMNHSIEINFVVLGKMIANSSKRRFGCGKDQSHSTHLL